MPLAYIIGLALALVFGGRESFAAEPPPTPEAAMSRFVTLNNGRALQTPEAKALLAGELADLRSEGGGDLPQPDVIVATGRSKAVARLPAVAGRSPDFYFYLERGKDGWRLVAARSLALTGVLAELVRLHDLAPTSDPAMVDAVRNARLVLSPDRVLVAWARQHRELLDWARSAPTSAEVERKLKAAGADRVRVEGGSVIVSIGGILDNEVGFMWPPDGKPPGLDPRSYIWIEEASAGWYLFKTT